MPSRLFDRALAEISQGVLIADPERKIVYANDAFVAITGFSREEILGQTCHFLHGADTDQSTVAEIRRALRARQPFAGEILNYRKTGEPFWNDLAITPIPDGRDGLSGFIGVTRDVTERWKAERERRALELQHNLMFDNVLAGIILHDARGELLYANPRAAELFGVTLDEVRGAQLTDRRWALLRDDGAPLAISEYPVSRAISTREIVPNLVIGISRADLSRTTWVMGNATPVFEGEGVLSKIVVSFTDVTESKEAEQALAIATEKAKAATEAKSQFLANMSHEIRTPLTGVLGYARMLQNLSGLPTEAVDLIEKIEANGQILLSTVNDVLDFSRLEADRISFNYLPTDVVTAISDALRIFEIDLVQRRLKLDLVITSPVPPILSIDPNRLRQILINLVANAIKFTPAGGVTVSVGFDPADAMLHFSVNDTGIGIAPDDLPNVFERFTQADVSTTRHFGGAGLGLAICKYLTERMGGSIGVESVVGAGSRFWFTLPARDNLATSRAEVELQTVNDTSLRGVKILVVDDNAMIRDLARRILEALGLDVVTAVDGFDGVAMARDHDFDIFLIDRQMPRLGGEAVAQQIRALPGANRFKPLIAFSADVIGDIPSVFDGYVSKPIDVNNLAQELARHLGPARSRLA